MLMGAEFLEYRLQSLRQPVFVFKLQGTSKNSFSASAGCEFYCVPLHSIKESQRICLFVGLAQRILAWPRLKTEYFEAI